MNTQRHTIGMRPEIKRSFFIVKYPYGAIVKLLGLHDGLTIHRYPTQKEYKGSQNVFHKGKLRKICAPGSFLGQLSGPDQKNWGPPLLSLSCPTSNKVSLDYQPLIVGLYCP